MGVELHVVCDEVASRRLLHRVHETRGRSRYALNTLAHGGLRNGGALRRLLFWRSLICTSCDDGALVQKAQVQRVAIADALGLGSNARAAGGHTTIALATRRRSVSVQGQTLPCIKRDATNVGHSRLTYTETSLATAQTGCAQSPSKWHGWVSKVGR